MREIKFRVRDNDTNKIIGYECLFPSDVKNKNYDWASSYNNRDWAPGVFRQSNLEREQYTGLKDKKGKEIFESDILQGRKYNKVLKRYVPSVVFWMDTHGIFEHKWQEGNPFHPELEFWNNEPLWKIASNLLDDAAKYIAVIGNIYENPELIK